MKKEEMRRILERADSLAELLRKALSERRYDEALRIAAERRSLLGIGDEAQRQDPDASPESFRRLLAGDGSLWLPQR